MDPDVIDIKTVFGSWPKRRLDVSAQELLRDIQHSGISRAITVSTTAILYDDVAGNEETMRTCEEHPALIPAATLHPQNYLEDERKIAALKERGFRIFRFFNKLQGYELDLYCVNRILNDLKKAEMPCIMDAVSVADAHKIARLSQEFELDIICTGLGYAFQAEVIALARDFPHVYFDAGRLTGPDGIELFCKHAGAHRLVYGSDYPFDNVLSSLYLLQHAGISERERELIAAGNIARMVAL